MALKILRETDPVNVDQLVLLIYGQPGIGKTSAAFTAKAPLLLDFDRGAHRSAFRKDSVPVDSWAEVAVLSPADLKPYQTIIVDTGGRALDALTAHLIRENPKLARSSGALTLPGFGELKAAFTGWIKQLRQLAKDVVILAHDAEDKQGDDLIVRPDFQGGSRQEVIKAADAIGYLYQRGRDKVLDFSPTDRWIGKNCAGIEPVMVPDFAQDPTFLADLIQRMKDTLNRQTEQQKEAAAEMLEWKEVIDGAKSAAEFTTLVTSVQNASDPIRETVKKMLVTAAKDAGYAYDRASGSFVEKAA